MLTLMSESFQNRTRAVVTKFAAESIDVMAVAIDKSVHNGYNGW